MICVDILGPWWDMEATGIDEETGETYTYRDQRRLPQFLYDLSDVPWQDITGQDSKNITPDPNLCVWRAWLTQEQTDVLSASERYEVLRQGEVDGAFQTPAGW